MLYLFGQLALSDSLHYHEDFDKDDYPAAVASSGPAKPEAGARPVAAGQRRHCEQYPSPADCAAINQPN
ncbi:hypothetical protein E4631_11870 [Hymenobacter sp. UV11]|uniref:hypothetical protein n=1 Tax=Hymenobacter sp. UV11 TaxID=1849735 RepID=UPI00105BE0F9|nr:hypothetical protein [Hymenobacter sp. UV11]TFZ66700.1 hypothetical protein E4631_11870 [Hymenobacter sp. UV11]